MPEDLNLEPEPWGSRPIEQRCGRRGAKRKERQRGIDRVAVLPLPAQPLPILRRGRPVSGRLIGRIDPDEEDRERRGNEQKTGQG